MQIKSFKDILTINPNLTPDKNEVSQKEGYYISYNPCTFDEGKEETAIYDRAANKFYILYGDFRTVYEASKSLEECKSCFKAWVKEHPEAISYTSDTCE